MMTSQLKPDDYAEFYSNYIKQLLNEELLDLLESSGNNLLNIINTVPAEKHEFIYAEGKWTLKQIILHLIDTERILSYRALCFARNDQTKLPGFDQDEYVENSGANSREMNDLLEEYRRVRKATISLFKNFTAETLQKKGIGNNKFMSVAAAGFVIVGHEKHHLEIFKTRYLNEK